MARTNITRAVEKGSLQYAERVDGAVFFRFIPTPGSRRKPTWGSNFVRGADGSYRCSVQMPEDGKPIAIEGMRLPKPRG